MIRPLALGFALGFVLRAGMTAAAWLAVPVLATLLENE